MPYSKLPISLPQACAWSFIVLQFLNCTLLSMLWCCTTASAAQRGMSRQHPECCTSCRTVKLVMAACQPLLQSILLTLSKIQTKECLPCMLGSQSVWACLEARSGCRAQCR